MTTTRLHQATHFLHVPDMEAALDFLTRVLRFEVRYRHANYAYLEWRPIGLRVLEERSRVRAVPGVDARMTLYVDVEDVDELFNELKPGLETLAASDVVGPEDHWYGQRELHVRLPDGHWVAFGQGVKRT